MLKNWCQNENICTNFNDHRPPAAIIVCDPWVFGNSGKIHSKESSTSSFCENVGKPFQGCRTANGGELLVWL